MPEVFPVSRLVVVGLLWERDCWGSLSKSYVPFAFRVVELCVYGLCGLVAVSHLGFKILLIFGVLAGPHMVVIVVLIVALGGFQAANKPIFVELVSGSSVGFVAQSCPSFAVVTMAIRVRNLFVLLHFHCDCVLVDVFLPMHASRLIQDLSCSRYMYPVCGPLEG